MKTIITLALLLITALPGYCATVFTSKEVLTAAKLNAALAEKASLSQNVNFAEVTTTAVIIPQSIAEQSITLFEAAANGSNSVTIKPAANLTADKIIILGNDGLYVDGVKVLPW